MKATLTSVDPHCRVWARAEASLWGMTKDHDLDEPVRLTEVVPVRLRYEDTMLTRQLVMDRALNLKTLGAGTHVALRFYFTDGSYREIEVVGVHVITPLDNEVNIK